MEGEIYLRHMLYWLRGILLIALMGGACLGCGYGHSKGDAAMLCARLAQPFVLRGTLQYSEEEELAVLFTHTPQQDCLTLLSGQLLDFSFLLDRTMQPPQLYGVCEDVRIPLAVSSGVSELFAALSVQPDTLVQVSDGLRAADGSAEYVICAGELTVVRTQSLVLTVHSFEVNTSLQQDTEMPHEDVTDEDVRGEKNATAG